MAVFDSYIEYHKLKGLWAEKLLIVPSWSTANRPTSSDLFSNLLGINTDTNGLEYYNGTAWQNISSSSSTSAGGSTNQFQYNNAGTFAGSPDLLQGTNQIIIGHSLVNAIPLQINSSNYAGIQITDNTGSAQYSSANVYALNQKFMLINANNDLAIETGIGGTYGDITFKLDRVGTPRTILTLSVDPAKINLAVVGTSSFNGTMNFVSAPTTYSTGGYDILVRNQTTGNVEKTTISGGSSLTINNNVDNRLLTANGGTTSIDAEAGLTYNPTANELAFPYDAVGTNYKSAVVFAGYSSIGALGSGAGFMMGTGVKPSTTGNSVDKLSNSGSQAHWITMRYDRGISFITGNDGATGTVFSDVTNERMRIDGTTGYVFIGATSSAGTYGLQVANKAYIKNTDANALVLNQNNINAAALDIQNVYTMGLAINGSAYTINGFDHDYISVNTVNHSFQFWSDNQGTGVTNWTYKFGHVNKSGATVGIGMQASQTASALELLNSSDVVKASFKPISSTNSNINMALTGGAYLDGGFIAKGVSTFTGEGVTLQYTGGIGYIDSYDFTNSVFKPFKFRGSTLTFNDGSADYLVANATSFTISSIRTSVTAPTTTGTVKMVVTDTNGLLSYQDIPSGGAGGLTAAYTAFTDGTNNTTTTAATTFKFRSANNILSVLVADNDVTHGDNLLLTVNSGNITSLGTISSGVWQGTAIADTYISSASTWNAKQPQLNGTGFVKASGTSITYDNTTYTPTSRILTINGTALDLSADRSWTIPGYSLPIASASVLGGVKVGTGLSIDGTGVLSSTAGVTINGNVDNRVITATGTANTLNGESNWTFDGTSETVGTYSAAVSVNHTGTYKQNDASGQKATFFQSSSVTTMSGNATGVTNTTNVVLFSETDLNSNSIYSGGGYIIEYFIKINQTGGYVGKKVGVVKALVDSTNVTFDDDYLTIGAQASSLDNAKVNCVATSGFQFKINNTSGYTIDIFWTVRAMGYYVP